VLEWLFSERKSRIKDQDRRKQRRQQESASRFLFECHLKSNQSHSVCPSAQPEINIPSKTYVTRDHYSARARTQTTSKSIGRAKLDRWDDKHVVCGIAYYLWPSSLAPSGFSFLTKSHRLGRTNEVCSVHPTSVELTQHNTTQPPCEEAITPPYDSLNNKRNSPLTMCMEDAVDEEKLILCCALCCTNCSVYPSCDALGASGKAGICCCNIECCLKPGESTPRSPDSHIYVMALTRFVPFNFYQERLFCSLSVASVAKWRTMDALAATCNATVRSTLNSSQ
jgi:hypothetical protein